MENMYLGLAHIAVNTNDLEKSIDFYKKLGGKISAEDGLDQPEGRLEIVMLELGGVTIELLYGPGARSTGDGAIPHIALYVKDVDQAAAAIRAAGIDSFKTAEKEVKPQLLGGVENWFFTGPSGEEIELMARLG